ncbi:NUDIX hydrolase [Desulfosarcina sp. OttesenSCG-928-A07]|nr:NUDIX hydrolase [Desulfosarcina sp. OttesenSCG-928-G17]MDL2329179.1 NUDIX hydrolase [Desulfosarcina sp. OttesenSCG-928-A07]
MNFCSRCGSPVTLKIPANEDRPRYVCGSCEMIHYQNPRLVVGCIPVRKDRILLCKRNIEPRKGYWTLPAGFLENGETTAEGAIRETYEETGSVVTELAPYRMVDILHAHQIYLIFLSRLEKMDFHPTPESSDVRLFSESEIPWDAIAFPVIKKILRAYYEDRLSNLFSFRMDRMDTPGRSGF